MTLDEQLDKLGPEFRIKMEKDRQNYYLDTLVAICKVFRCSKMVNELNDVFPMIKFLESFYNAGFYKGLIYGIDAGENVVIPDTDIPIKFTDKISEEINQSILNKTKNNDITTFWEASYDNDYYGHEA